MGVETRHVPEHRIVCDACKKEHKWWRSQGVAIAVIAAKGDGWTFYADDHVWCPKCDNDPLRPSGGGVPERETCLKNH